MDHIVTVLYLYDCNNKGPNTNNRTMEYGWRQNKDFWVEQLVDPPNEYIIKIYYNIVTSCFDSLATRHSSKHKNTSSQHWDAPGFNG